MHLCNRLLYSRCATYAIVNASASLLRAPVKCFNTLCLLEGFARISYPSRGDERLLVQFPSKYRESESRIVCSKYNEINFSAAWVIVIRYIEVR